MAIEQGGNQLIPAHRNRHDVNLDIATAKRVVNVLFEPLQQVPGSAAR